jgi:hypothetical protein
MQYHVDVTNSTSTALDKGEYLHNNHQSSIIAYSDKSGALLSSNAYDVYGIPASSNSGRFGYTGQLWLPELRLYYYNRLGVKQIGGQVACFTILLINPSTRVLNKKIINMYVLIITRPLVQ